MDFELNNALAAKFVCTYIRIYFFGENFQFLRRELGEKIVDIDVVEFLEVFAIELLGRHSVDNLVGDLGIARERQSHYSGLLAASRRKKCRWK